MSDCYAIRCPTCRYQILRPTHDGTGYVLNAKAIIIKSVRGLNAEVKCPQCRSRNHVPLQLAPRPTRCVVSVHGAEITYRRDVESGSVLP